MQLLKNIQSFIDRYVIVCMIPIATVVLYLNWYAEGMSGLLPAYTHFKDIIQQWFNHTDLITFPMWGYGWLMLISTSKIFLLLFQMVLALGSIFYFFQFLELKHIVPKKVLFIFKICTILSLPWYALHALRWPYSISASLLLLSIVLLCDSYSKKDVIIWSKLLLSAIAFGLLLNFRSDYWLMPFGLAFLLLVFYRTKASLFAAFMWVGIIYSCLIPWALYTKKACGHHLLTSTNAGHVMFIGFGDQEDNRWGITVSDSDPLMHALVDEHFHTTNHSTLDYEANRFLTHTFFTYIATYPRDYIKKCWCAFMKLVTQGCYFGEFLSQDRYDELFGAKRLSHILTDRFFILNAWSEITRLSTQTISFLISKYVILGAYILLPVVGFSCLLASHSLIIWMSLAIIMYQTLLNVLCGYLPSYPSTIYIFYLWSVVYSGYIVANLFGISLNRLRIAKYVRTRKHL